MRLSRTVMFGSLRFQNSENFVSLTFTFFFHVRLKCPRKGGMKYCMRCVTAPECFGAISSFAKASAVLRKQETFSF